MKFDPEPLPIDDYAKSGAWILRCDVWPEMCVVHYVKAGQSDGWMDEDMNIYKESDFIHGYWRLPQILEE